jgi:hypothetical protein
MNAAGRDISWWRCAEFVGLGGVAGDLLVAEVPHRGLGPSSITCATPGAEALRWEEAGLYPELARDEFSVHASEEHSGTYHQYDAADYQRGIVPVGMKRAERDQ